MKREIEVGASRDKEGISIVGLLLRVDGAIRWDGIHNLLATCFGRSLLVDRIEFGSYKLVAGEKQDAILRFRLPIGRIRFKDMEARPGADRLAILDIEYLGSAAERRVRLRVDEREVLETPVADVFDVGSERDALMNRVVAAIDRQAATGGPLREIELRVRDSDMKYGDVVMCLAALLERKRVVFIEKLAPWPPAVPMTSTVPTSEDSGK